MTKLQQRFYNMIKQQMVDFDEVFHKEYMIQRLSKIPDESLKDLLESINVDKDRVGKKGYITYAKFVHYAQKIIDTNINFIANKGIDKVEQLYKKRDILIRTIENSAKTLQERNDIIKKIETKQLMFKGDDGKNILDNIDYYIISQFGFYNFFDENRNYNVKDEIKKYFFEYLQETSLNQQLLLQR